MSYSLDVLFLVLLSNINVPAPRLEVVLNHLGRGGEGRGGEDRWRGGRTDGGGEVLRMWQGGGATSYHLCPVYSRKTKLQRYTAKHTYTTTAVVMQQATPTSPNKVLLALKLRQSGSGSFSRM